jgi:hypothetical protein
MSYPQKKENSSFGGIWTSLCGTLRLRFLRLGLRILLFHAHTQRVSRDEPEVDVYDMGRQNGQFVHALVEETNLLTEVQRVWRREMRRAMLRES